MGRLFWKFFAFVWLAQLAGIIAIGTMFWLAGRGTDAALKDIAWNPTVDAQLGAAAEVLRYAGPEAFRNWSEQGRGLTVFALDAAGRDVFGRSPPASITAEIRRLPGDRSKLSRIRDVELLDGRRYTLFAVWNDAGQPSGMLTSPPLPPDNWPRTAPPALAMVATLAASVMTALLLAAYVAKPVRSLRQAFEAAAAGDLDGRVAPLLGGRQDELADLGRDFDRMAGRLKASMQGQRRLLHDVSHELRSPLARLQAAAGLMRQKPEQFESMLTRIDDEIARIDRLVGELLTLSRLESGELIAENEEVDMRELVDEIVHDANFEAQAQDREVIWEDRGSATLQGRPELLHSAIENIVRNALKHAPESRIVQVETSVDVHQRLYTLRVLDDGRGMPEEDLPGLFTPFFRGATGARSKGYGLGLAIARRSIEAHGGAICAHNRVSGGLSVEIVLPWHMRAVANDGQGTVN